MPATNPHTPESPFPTVARRVVPPPLPRSQPHQDFSGLFDAAGAGTTARSAAAPWKTSLLLIALAGILFFHSWRHGYLLGELAVPILALGVLHGLWRGGFRKIILLAAMVGLLYGVAAAGPAIEQIGPASAASASGWGYLIACVLAIFLFLVLSVVTQRVRRRVVLRRPVVRTVDRFFGMAVGFAEAALIPLAVCWTAVEARPHLMTIRDHPEIEADSFRRTFAASMVQLADESHAGVIGRLVDVSNPIGQVPILRKIFDDLNTCGQIRLDDLGNLDPATAEKLNELLKQSPLGLDALKQLKDSQQQSSQTAEQVYRQLPSQQSR